MPDVAKLYDALRREAERIEEDSTLSAKGHFNAADTWRQRHYWIGIPATILGAVAGAAIVKDWREVAGIVSVGATLLTGLLTFLKPGERASAHKMSGDQHLALRNETRVFRAIELIESEDVQLLSDKLKALAQRRNELNQSSPEIPRRAFEKARRGIEQGEAAYKTDLET
jgi:hypothetical protein